MGFGLQLTSSAPLPLHVILLFTAQLSVTVIRTGVAATCQTSLSAYNQLKSWQDGALPASTHQFWSTDPRGHFFDLTLYQTQRTVSAALQCGTSVSDASLACTYTLHAYSDPLANVQWLGNFSTATPICQGVVQYVTSDYYYLISQLNVALIRNSSPTVAILSRASQPSIPVFAFTIDGITNAVLMARLNSQQWKDTSSRGLSSNTTFNGFSSVLLHNGIDRCVNFTLNIAISKQVLPAQRVVRIFRNGTLLNDSDPQVSLQVYRTALNNSDALHLCFRSPTAGSRDGQYDIVVYMLNQHNRHYYAEQTLVHSFTVAVNPIPTTTHPPTSTPPPVTTATTKSSERMAGPVSSGTHPTPTTGRPTAAASSSSGQHITTTSASSSITPHISPSTSVSNLLIYVIGGTAMLLVVVVSAIVICYVKRSCKKSQRRRGQSRRRAENRDSEYSLQATTTMTSLCHHPDAITSCTSDHSVRYNSNSSLATSSLHSSTASPVQRPLPSCPRAQSGAESSHPAVPVTNDYCLEPVHYAPSTAVNTLPRVCEEPPRSAKYEVIPNPGGPAHAAWKMGESLEDYMDMAAIKPTPDRLTIQTTIRRSTHNQQTLVRGKSDPAKAAEVADAGAAAKQTPVTDQDKTVATACQSQYTDMASIVALPALSSTVTGSSLQDEGELEEPTLLLSTTIQTSGLGQH